MQRGAASCVRYVLFVLHANVGFRAACSTVETDQIALVFFVISIFCAMLTSFVR